MKKVEHYVCEICETEYNDESNDAFHENYGFNFNPHEYKGLYEVCRKIVFGS